MSHAHVNWDDLPWQPGNHPLEHKKVVPGHPCCLLMFLPGFEDPQLCQRSHVLHVLEGTLSLGLSAGNVLCAAGETVILPNGTAHRAANESDAPVVLLAVSDLGWKA